MPAFELAHVLLRQALQPGDWVVDATVGNGHDTLFLAQRVGPSGRVFGFDIQDAALAIAAERLHSYPHVTLINSGHETLKEHLPVGAQNQLAAVMFNLGYLPGANKNMITQSATTLEGLKQSIAHLKIRGLVTLVLYSGHPGGAQEATAVRAFVQDLPQSFATTQHARINSLNPAPELLVIERVI